MGFREFILKRCGSEWGSQSRLARATSRSQGTVARWIDGTSTPDMPSCLAIAEELNIDPVAVMRAAGLAERDIERFVRYCPAEKPDERSVYGRSDATVHRKMQRLLDAIGQPVREHIDGLAESVADLQRRLEECMATSGAAGAHLRLDERVFLECGEEAADGWEEISEGRLAFGVLKPTNGGWRHFGGMLLKYAELALSVRGLLR